ncbi:MAG: spherulation-specific family 4 protein [Candidatus Gracilibacteria bacterium]|nr:spherulation-specific family 4 protein [Candidatus Gracilibacteria bacterium]
MTVQKNVKFILKTIGITHIGNLKNVTLKKFEEIQLTDENIKFQNNGNSEEEQDNSNTDNTSNTNNNQVNYPKIDLSSYKYMIPAYWWNDDLNQKLLVFDNKSVIAIVNPSNGDFSKSEEIFKDMIKNIHNKQNLAIGYIHSGYGKRNLGDIKRSIDNWLQYYPNIEGIFVDETSNKVSDYDFYQEIFNYIKSKNTNLAVVLNTGINAPEKFINISDNLIIYENPCSDYGNYSLDSWINKYSKHNFTFLGYSCSKSQYNNLSNKYKDYITYFTDDGSDGNPWDSLSKYLYKSNNSSDNGDNNGDNDQSNNQDTDTQNINTFEVSPYTDVSLYPFEELSKVYDKTKHKDYTLAFIVSKNNKCTASWGGYYNIENGPDAWINGTQKFLYNEVKYVQNKGGKITVSFGGAAGTPLFENCDNSDLLFNEYQKVINKVNPTEIDFGYRR